MVFFDITLFFFSHFQYDASLFLDKHVLSDELFCFVSLCEITLKQNGLVTWKHGVHNEIRRKVSIVRFLFQNRLILFNKVSFTYNKMHRCQVYSSINFDNYIISMFSPPQHIYFFSSRISPFGLLYSVLPQLAEATTLWILKFKN